MSHLFCFGMGYSGRAVARWLATERLTAKRPAAEGWRSTGTSRSQAGAAKIDALGHKGLVFDGQQPGAGIGEALQSASHVLICAAPDEDGDPVLRHHAEDIAGAKGVTWIGYLSTVGVYGDFQGAWVDESAALKPASERGRRRVRAEAAWQGLGRKTGRGVHIFRLAGIYGPGRSPLEKVKNGTARRLIKPDQVFNRIHVEDIAGALKASIARPNPGTVYNVADDEPAPPQDVVTFAADLLGVQPPPNEAFETADLTPMARSFYGENKRVSNARLKIELGYQLQYPNFRVGLQALVDKAG